MQRSCADVNSPYKRKCWTNSGGPLVNSLLKVINTFIASPPPPQRRLSDDYWYRYPGNFDNFLRRQQFAKASIFSKCAAVTRKKTIARIKRYAALTVCILRFFNCFQREYDTRIFEWRFFSWITFPRALIIPMGAISHFYENSFSLFSLVCLFFDEGSSTFSTLFKALMDASLYLFFKKTWKETTKRSNKFLPQFHRIIQYTIKEVNEKIRYHLH